MEAMMGKLSDGKQSNLFIIDEVDKTQEFNEDEKASGEINLKTVPIVYIKNCKNGNYTFNRRTTKIFIENCENCTVTVRQNVLTNTIEAWKGKNLTLNVQVECKTVQLDILEGVKLSYDKGEYMAAVVWNEIATLDVSFADVPEAKIKSGTADMKTIYPDSTEVDQYILRFVDGKLLHERCIRLKNGHLSTEREAIDWDRRNTKAKEAYMQKFMKEAGIHLNKSEGKTKPKPNDKCTCGSGKKFKKCCMHLKEAEGTRNITYKQ